MTATPISMPVYIDRVVDFPEGASYEITCPLTTFRHCHDGRPAEARMVFTCRQISQGTASSAEYVMKVKVRVPDRVQEASEEPEPESSTTTRAELKALTRFREANITYAPLLVAFKTGVQGANGPRPGGYITYTVMTQMPGDSLHNLYYWGMSEEERQEIIQEFLVALTSIYALGIEPVDCALRNVLWERETKRWYVPMWLVVGANHVDISC
ncbi:hypothetical protein LTR10_013429 [Elasticomyces elasticus]|uniref:Protein kinase domain-containing protein n=1 Tax=Exophiala sideris TaxID=1016849 RepID=A0ABR0J4U7_9EURO|nr:hypothetical protein LTR10_013429 [Elasticomyces elasticus]KAK5027341.1 hypothetical protein LTS07_006943 [Exophiala sideris]KAK5034957.1 hypothetical protein LTR13_006139 [Exophiala sideris]KAK5056309.1 hypothetical protein LTR69_007850 [Exophiala sideris]KAK5181202.1 hypothetical protein LTR44_006533 [Eurotiomycetes sp. CCFEE 6388]